VVYNSIDLILRFGLFDWDVSVLWRTESTISPNLAMLVGHQILFIDGILLILVVIDDFGTCPRRRPLGRNILEDFRFMRWL
jgi:hypothetical protein